jgi:hypothetical protein
MAKYASSRQDFIDRVKQLLKDVNDTIIGTVPRKDAVTKIFTYLVDNDNYTHTLRSADETVKGTPCPNFQATVEKKLWHLFLVDGWGPAEIYLRKLFPHSGSESPIRRVEER